MRVSMLKRVNLIRFLNVAVREVFLWKVGVFMSEFFSEEMTEEIENLSVEQLIYLVLVLECSRFIVRSLRGEVGASITPDFCDSDKKI